MLLEVLVLVVEMFDPRRRDEGAKNLLARAENVGKQRLRSEPRVGANLQACRKAIVVRPSVAVGVLGASLRP